MIRIFFLLFCSLIQVAFAKLECDVCIGMSRIYIEPQAYYLRMKILDANGLGFSRRDINSKLDGGQGGFRLGYEFQKLRSLYTNLWVSWNMGDIDGSNVSSRLIHDETAEARFGYNYVALQGNPLIVTPYLGFGFNYMSQWRSASPDLKLSYYNYYIPVGAILDYEIYDFFRIAFDFTWMPQVDSTVKIRGIDGGRWVLNLKSGYRAELPFIFKIGENLMWDFRISPFWQRTLNGSTIQASGPILLNFPKQVYTYWGGRASLGTTF